MHDGSSELALVSFSSDVALVLQRTGCPQNIAELVEMYAVLAEKMQDRRLPYLPLPAAIAVVGEHPVYPVALCWGRGFYYDALHDVDESGQLVRVPVPFSRAEILEEVKGMLFPTELRLAASIPLAWRVGVVVGWLSGLSISQREDAQAGMVLLAALVAPLLSSSHHKQVK